jgi:hypothetical protein
MRHFIVSLGCGLGAAGCTYGPFQDDTIPSTTTTVTFNMYALSAGDLMTAECATHYSPFVQFGSKVASSTPIELNGDSIYEATLKKKIPASCWDYCCDRPVTFLRFYQRHGDRKDLTYVFDRSDIGCVNDALADGETPQVAGMNCGAPETLRLFAQY